jgi:ring-1,2-phenylacetyl-CoA epoxidase subunit PaaD
VVSAPEPADARRARRIAESVPDPELPMLTLADLGVLREVRITPDGTVIASLTPTYSGCPAIAPMRAQVAAQLREAGFERVQIRTVLSPPWTTDWITAAGRRKLAQHGIAPPTGSAERRRAAEPVSLAMPTLRRPVPCPQCESADTEQTSRFAATPCMALWRCRACLEPFQLVKDI